MVWLLVRVVGIHSLGFGIKENDQMPHSHWWIWFAIFLLFFFSMNNHLRNSPAYSSDLLRHHPPNGRTQYPNPKASIPRWLIQTRKQSKYDSLMHYVIVIGSNTKYDPYVWVIVRLCLNEAIYRRNVKSLNSPHYVVITWYIPHYVIPPPTHSTRLTYRSYVELYFGMRVPPIGGNCIPNAIIKSIPNADRVT